MHSGDYLVKFERFAQFHSAFRVTGLGISPFNAPIFTEISPHLSLSTFPLCILAAPPP